MKRRAARRAPANRTVILDRMKNLCSASTRIAPCERAPAQGAFCDDRERRHLPAQRHEKNGFCKERDGIGKPATMALD
ncbi:DUF2309 domain-containing protein [Burkholderia sp. WAC0059]|uniref:DUF2309 domain-containing protein n=1 Tax=Burkholderia sp. WAC0059 TaxID=2066022 RepID=UPI0011AF18D4|nr:DUF2309 domain-containing protein [Burkholderia sp. WAC0059]